MERIDMSSFQFFDINHVREKHKLTEDGDYLLERLGKANTKRRQLRKYNEQHHDKIVGRRQDVNPAIDDTDNGDEGGVCGQDAQIQSRDATDNILGFDQRDYMSQTASTNVSTVYEAGLMSSVFNQFRHDDDIADEDNRSESGYSQTSYASSSAWALGSDKLRVPPPPNQYDGQPFECPYCFRIVTDIDNRNAW
jgi:hypothetical protein